MGGGGETERWGARGSDVQARFGGQGKPKGNRAKGGAKHSHQVREHNHVLKLTRQPHQVQGVLVRRDLVGQRRRIVGAQPAPAVRVDADAKVADASRASPAMVAMARWAL